MPQTTVPAGVADAKSVEDSPSLELKNIIIAVCILLICCSLALYTSFDITASFASLKLEAVKVKGPILNTLLLGLTFISFLIFMYMYLSYNLFLKELFLYERLIAKKNLKAIQSFLIAIDQELAIKSQRIYFTKRQSLIGTHLNPINKLDPLVILLLSGLIALSIVELLYLVSPNRLGTKLFLGACVFLAFYWANSSITLKVSETVNAIRKEILQQVKNSSSPATKYCEFNQTTSRRFKRPEGLCLQSIEMIQNLFWQIAVSFLLISFGLTFLIFG